MAKNRLSWSGAWALSALAHVGFMLLPTPGSSARSPRRPSDPLKLTIRSVEPPPPEPRAEPEPPPSPPPERAHKTKKPRRRRARRPEPPPAEPRAPEVASVEPPPAPPKPAVVETAPQLGELDLELRPKAGRFGPASRGTWRLPIPRVETSPIPEGLSPTEGGGFEFRDRGFVAEIARDGTVSFKGGTSLDYSGTGASFDITDGLMSASGDDPYHYEKAKFLKRTRAFREGLYDRARKQNLAEATRTARKRIEAIWFDGSDPVAVRRERLFKLWDECLETGDEAAVLAARFVRSSVLAFIRRTIPRGDPDAFSQDELERLNEGRYSKQRFSPYAAVD